MIFHCKTQFYLFEKQRVREGGTETEMENSILLVHSPNIYSNQGWPRPESQRGNSTQVFCEDGRDPRTWILTYCFPGSELSENCSWKKYWDSNQALWYEMGVKHLLPAWLWKATSFTQLVPSFRNYSLLLTLVSLWTSGRAPPCPCLLFLLDFVVASLPLPLPKWRWASEEGWLLGERDFKGSMKQKGSCLLLCSFWVNLLPL